MIVTAGIYICMNFAKAMRDPWVRAQILLLLIAGVLGPVLPRQTLLGPLHPLLARIDGWPVRAAGVALALVALAFAFWAARALGPALTPEPEPLPGASLVESGPYRIVRHPIYTGLIGAVAGWTLAWSNWTLALVVALVLLAFFEGKAAVEERWLAQRFPAFAAYRTRVRRRILRADRRGSQRLP
jgi:protein-S-isoprenylcysteine O-methyltransferase Ste14